MKSNSKVEKNKKAQARLMIVIGILMLITLTTSTIIIALRQEKKNNNSEELVPFSGNTDFDVDDESDIITENLPYIRLNKYNANTGERYGLLVTNEGDIYKYSFIETNVDYPNSDKFVINQTIYFDNITEEVGKISENDLNTLKGYTENVTYDYSTTNPVFDTVGNSISYTNYMLEENIVLINSEGVKNLNDNTNNILSILAKYNIKL